ncbi:hypothetical protein [Bifidobacterium sp. ESL0745]|nr:hypothetical protein [Bifidobacterium sp. ESL0745]MDF7664987.1 hypothetical protein [Bifidobacterium sp. ESL0745]
MNKHTVTALLLADSCRLPIAVSDESSYGWYPSDLAQVKLGRKRRRGV